MSYPIKTIAKYYKKFGGETAVVSQSIQIISRSSSYFLYKLLLLLWVDPKLSWINLVARYVSKAFKSITSLKKLKLFITRPLYCFLFVMHSSSRSRALLLVEIVFSDHLLPIKVCSNFQICNQIGPILYRLHHKLYTSIIKLCT